MSVNELTLQTVRDQIAQNIREGKYPPLPEAARALILPYYQSQIPEFLKRRVKDNAFLYVRGIKDPIAAEAVRIVVGDYGAYVEISPENMARTRIQHRYPGWPKRAIKYFWMETVAEVSVKVYFQIDTVKYADYIPGMYYIAVEDFVEP